MDATKAREIIGYKGAREIIDSMSLTDERGEFWWLSDVFAVIGYEGTRQMNTEVMRAFAMGAHQGGVEALDILNVNRPVGGRGRPRSDWRLSRRGLYLFIMTCGAKTPEMDRLRACLVTLALG